MNVRITTLFKFNNNSPSKGYKFIKTENQKVKPVLYLALSCTGVKDRFRI